MSDFEEQSFEHVEIIVGRCNESGYSFGVSPRETVYDRHLNSIKHEMKDWCRYGFFVIIRPRGLVDGELVEWRSFNGNGFEKVTFGHVPGVTGE